MTIVALIVLYITYSSPDHNVNYVEIQSESTTYKDYDCIPLNYDPLYHTIQKSLSGCVQAASDPFLDISSLGTGDNARVMMTVRPFWNKEAEAGKLLGKAQDFESDQTTETTHMKLFLNAPCGSTANGADHSSPPGSQDASASNNWRNHEWENNGLKKCCSAYAYGGGMDGEKAFPCATTTRPLGPSMSTCPVTEVKLLDQAITGDDYIHGDPEDFALVTEPEDIVCMRQSPGGEWLPDVDAATAALIDRWPAWPLRSAPPPGSLWLL